MSFAIAFWIIMLVWLLWNMPFNPWSAGAPYGNNLILFLLLLLLGWRVFGAPLQG